MPKDLKRKRQTTFSGLETEEDVKEAIRILRSKQTEAGTVDIDAIMDEVLDRIGGTVNTEVVSNGTSAAFSFRRVDDLPAVGISPEIVIWNSPNGDDDFWVSKPGTAYWAPVGHFSNKSGTP